MSRAGIQTDWQNRRAALVVGHPGHELRVYHWMEVARPLVFVLTDGSGKSEISRLPSTTSVLQSVGARVGEIYGRWTDRAVYSAILNQNVRMLADVVRELAEALRAARIQYVVGDAAEGYNPTHDLCRYLVDAAIILAERQSGEQMGNFEFPLIGRPDECPKELQDETIRVQLEPDALERKIAAAHNYEELRMEVESALQRFGKTPFATELLLPVDSAGAFEKFRSTPPYYETYGAQQVAAGHYRDVIRYSQHVEPLISSVWEKLGLQ